MSNIDADNLSDFVSKFVIDKSLYVAPINLRDYESAAQMRVHNIGAGGLWYINSKAINILVCSDKRRKQYYIRKARKLGERV